MKEKKILMISVLMVTVVGFASTFRRHHHHRHLHHSHHQQHLTIILHTFAQTGTGPARDAFARTQIAERQKHAHIDRRVDILFKKNDHIERI